MIVRALFLRRRVGLPFHEARRTDMTAWVREHGPRYPAATCYRCGDLLGRARAYRELWPGEGVRMAVCVHCAVDVARMVRWTRQHLGVVVSAMPTP